MKINKKDRIKDRSKLKRYKYSKVSKLSKFKLYRIIVLFLDKHVVNTKNKIYYKNIKIFVLKILFKILTILFAGGIILLSLRFLNYQLTKMNLLSAVALYFVIEEIKYFIIKIIKLRGNNK